MTISLQGLVFYHSYGWLARRENIRHRADAFKNA